MIKFFSLVCLVVVLTGCINLFNQPVSNVVGNQARSAEVWLAYTPMQCLDAPWQQWYRSGQGPKYFKAPTEEELVRDYLSLVQGIEVKKVEKATPTGVVFCQACLTCPQGYYLNVLVSRDQRQKLLELGWEDTIKVRE